MELLTQEAMGRLFTVTDELGVDREHITVPLERAGDGAVRAVGDDRWEIQLPPGDGPLETFLATLPATLRAAGYVPPPALGVDEIGTDS